MTKKVNITHPEKIYWPEEQLTKGDLVNYYETIAPFILPYLKNRPMSLKRNPNGIRDKGFYHKDAGDIAPAWMKVAPIVAESTGKTVHYLLCNDLPSLKFIANLNCIEMNPWNSRVPRTDKPDYVVMDIDPSDKNNFNQVIDVALVIKSILDRAGVSAYCKTSGSTGIHIYIPFNRRYTYAQGRDFARIVAERVVEEVPEIATLERSLKKRRADQIYIDYLQNSEGQTLASAYSARPKPGATVSAPLKWKEVKYGLSLQDFTIKSMPRRVKRVGDLFEGVLGKGLDLRKAMRALDTL